MKWIEALKFWNNERQHTDAGHMWCVPRKGTPEHAEVIAIMKRNKPAAVAARNKERAEKSLEQLRQHESKIKGHNLSRDWLGATAAAAAGAAPRAAGVEEPEPAPKAKSPKKRKGFLTEEGAKLAAQLPANAVEQIVAFAGTGTAFNLGRIFLKGNKYENNGILYMLYGIMTEKDIMFFRALQKEWCYTDLGEETDESGSEVREIFKLASGEKRREYPLLIPTKTQREMLEDAFPKLKISMYHRQGTLGNPSGCVFRYEAITSGLNLRTKEGRAARDKILLEAKQKAYNLLGRLHKADYWKFVADRHEKEREKKEATKAANKELGRQIVSIASTEAKAEYVHPDMFEAVFLAFLGDPQRARRKAAELQAAYPGRDVKFWGRKNLNMRVRPT